MLQCSQPRPLWANKGEGPRWFDDADRLAKLAIYCAQDIWAERDLDRYLPELPPTERQIWEQTERLNRRGVPLDLKLIDVMTSAVEHESKASLDRIIAATGDPDFALTNPKKILDFLHSRGVHLDDLRKETVQAALQGHYDGVSPLGAIPLAVLEARRDVGGKSSTSKLPRMRARIMPDGRARDLVIYHGAHTGRDTGDGINTLNLPRPYKKFDQDFVVFRGPVSEAHSSHPSLRAVVTARRYRRRLFV